MGSSCARHSLALPPIIYIFFVHGGPNGCRGVALFLFYEVMKFFSFKQHRAVANRLSQIAE
jgi:hypothetical protein